MSRPVPRPAPPTGPPPAAGAGRRERYRVWVLYLAGAAPAFAENRMGVYQVLMVRPDADGPSGPPRARAELLGGC